MIISIVNTKGGVGKTTITLGLAEALAQRGKRILAVDADGPQGSLTERCARIVATGGELPFALDQSREIIPPDSDIEDDTTAWNATLARLRKTLRSAPSHDHVVIDGPPHNLRVQSALVRASDLVLIPVTPDAMSSRSAQTIVGSIRRAAADGKVISAAMLLNEVAPRELASQYVPQITAQHGLAILDVQLPKAATLNTADISSTLIGASRAGRAWLDVVGALIDDLEI